MKWLQAALSKYPKLLAGPLYGHVGSESVIRRIIDFAHTYDDLEDQISGIERVFSVESSAEERKKLYHHVYSAVHPIYAAASSNTRTGKNPKDRIVNLFRKEVEGKSILDVGCGRGDFLASIAKRLKQKRLEGIG